MKADRNYASRTVKHGNLALGELPCGKNPCDDEPNAS